MKLQALEGRIGRDGADVAKLLSLLEIADLAAAEELYESYYPGDALNDATASTVQRMFERGLPEVQGPPEAFDFGGGVGGR